jgi:hypothetical protein
MGPRNTKRVTAGLPGRRHWNLWLVPVARIRFGSRPALRGPRRVPAQRTGGFLFDPRRFPDSIFRTGVFYYRNTGKDLRTKFFHDELGVFQ